MVPSLGENINFVAWLSLIRATALYWNLMPSANFAPFTSVSVTESNFQFSVRMKSQSQRDLTSRSQVSRRRDIQAASAP